MRLFRNLSAALLTLALVIGATQLSSAETRPRPPLWRGGKYYGGYPTIDKYLTQGITFRISPDKITMKDVSIEFPADCYDEHGVPTERSIHFSPTEIEPLTLVRTSSRQSVYFAYLDAFNLNWNTELVLTWSRARQSFRISINTLTDTVEGTYCKSNAIIARGAKRRSRSSS